MSSSESIHLRLKPDFLESQRRYEAFWEQTVIDRPPVSIVLPSPQASAEPRKSYSSQWDRWTDVEFRAEQMAVNLANKRYLGDALPVAFPNMGPEIFSAWCGAGYRFGESTAWSEPCIGDWDRDAGSAVFNADHPLFRLTVQFTELLLERGRENFLVGLTDFHPGGDHLAALRDPEIFAVDMVENREWVKKKLAAVNNEYFHVYDIFYGMLRRAGMPITSWTPLINDGRYYIPSNDFSCMISSEMFDDFFLPGIIEECRFLDRSIYHLDGPGALRHLDSILSISELDAVQWVPGAGNTGYARWVDVYRRIQKAGKSLQIKLESVEELPLVFETLRPEGVWISRIGGIDSDETAEEVLKRVSEWR